MQRSNLNPCPCVFPASVTGTFCGIKTIFKPTHIHYTCLATYNTARRRWDQKTWWASRLCIHRGPKLQQQPDSHRKKAVKETQGIPELRNVVVYIDCDWSLRWPCDFCGGKLLACSSHMFTLGCKEWQVHGTDRTWGTELANSSVRKM